MKKLILTFIILGTSSFIFAQQLVLRTNLLSHLRPNPTINLNIGLLNGKNKSIEYYLSLEKAYASFDNVVRGVFRPDNSKLNLEYGLGFKKGLSKNVDNKNRFFVFGEVEYAELNYLLVTAQTKQDYNGYFGTVYSSNSYVNIINYHFSRIQSTAGIGIQLKLTKSFGINLTLSGWLSNHFSINKGKINSKYIGQSIKDKVNEYDKEFLHLNDTPSKTFGSSDSQLDSRHKIKLGVQLGLSFYYIFGK